MKIYTEELIRCKYSNSNDRWAIFDGDNLIGFIDITHNEDTRYTANLIYEYDEYMDYNRNRCVGERNGYNTFVEAKIKLINEYENNPPKVIRKRKAKMKIETLPLGDNSDFYPTPSKLAGLMFSRIGNWEKIHTILEPSAGKGDLVEMMNHFLKKGHYSARSKDVDCIEEDVNLRYILEGKHLKVVYDDFLKFPANKQYDLLIMNPPFSTGSKHLLKALSMQKHGGQICCVLNAETLKNPYTNERKTLLAELERVNAKIKYVSRAFKRAQRCSDVEIAVIWIDIPMEYGESVIVEGLKKASPERDFMYNPKEIVRFGDWIDNMITQFENDNRIVRDFLREYESIKQFFSSSFDNDKYSRPFIELNICGNQYSGINACLKTLRNKYWYALLHKEELVSKFTSNLRQKFSNMLNDMNEYDFNRFNIDRIIKRMNAELITGIEAQIEEIFDKLTAEHTWYPECRNNKHYYNGWSTNMAHKLGMKSIIPAYGVFSDNKWNTDAFRVREAYSTLADIEKVFDYLDGCATAEVDLYSLLNVASQRGITRHIQLKYFSVTFYKKGTVHIKFNQETERIIDSLNIYVGKRRKWLPPHYGKASYDSFSYEERSKIDEFQGKDKYNKIVSNQDIYLYEISNVNFMLT